MQIVSSYGVEIKQKNIPLCSTLDIFRKAVSYLIPVYAETWEELSEIRNPQKRFNEAEHLVHETKKNHARFPFDRHFPKMPSYSDPTRTWSAVLLSDTSQFVGKGGSEGKAEAGL